MPSVRFPDMSLTQDKPTSWTPTDSPISVDSLGRQPPPSRQITVLPNSRLTRAWVVRLESDGAAHFEAAFAVSTEGEDGEFVFKHASEFCSYSEALRGLRTWLLDYEFADD
jgi:hypothetical protein